MRNLLLLLIVLLLAWLLLQIQSPETVTQLLDRVGIESTVPVVTTSSHQEKESLSSAHSISEPNELERYKQKQQKEFKDFKQQQEAEFNAFKEQRGIQ